MSSNELRPSVSPENRGPIVNIVTWLLLVATVLAVIFRTATQQALSRGVCSPNDLIIATALIFSVGQTVMVSLQTENGLGQHQTSLTTSQVNRYQQFDYAANLLFIVNLCLTKTSLLFLLWKITPEKIQKMFLVGTGISTIIWAGTAETAAALQCQLPRPWNYLGGACFDRTSFWNYVGIVNILTDVALILLCFGTAWNIRISLKRRLVVAGYFAPRLFVVAAIIAQLAYVNQASGTSDLTYSTWQLIISTQFVQNLSVITACIPGLRPFFDSLETGFIRNDDLRRQHIEGIYIPNNYSSRFPNSTRANVCKASAQARDTLFSNKALELNDYPQRYRGDDCFFGTSMTNNATVRAGISDSDVDTESQSSWSQFVRQSTTWMVESEPRSWLR